MEFLKNLADTVQCGGLKLVRIPTGMGGGGTQVCILMDKYTKGIIEEKFDTITITTAVSDMFDDVDVFGEHKYTVDSSTLANAIGPDNLIRILKESKVQMMQSASLRTHCVDDFSKSIERRLSVNPPDNVTRIR